MKRVAIFVEGETEFDFVLRLIEELAVKIDISIQIRIVKRSTNNTIRSAILTGKSSSEAIVFQTTLNVSGSDSQVLIDIRKNAEILKDKGFNHIIGLKDLKGNDGEYRRRLTLQDLSDVELADRVLEILCQPMRAKIVTAVMEIETWFLAETTHYECRANKLTKDFVKANITELGFNPYDDEVDTLTNIADSKAALRKLYGLAGRSYSTRSKVRTKTINCLDYTNLYLNTRHRLTKLDNFITEIDTFLSI